MPFPVGMKICKRILKISSSEFDRCTSVDCNEKYLVCGLENDAVWLFDTKTFQKVCEFT